MVKATPCASSGDDSRDCFRHALREAAECCADFSSEMISPCHSADVTMSLMLPLPQLIYIHTPQNAATDEPRAEAMPPALHFTPPVAIFTPFSPI